MMLSELQLETLPEGVRKQVLGRLDAGWETAGRGEHQLPFISTVGHLLRSELALQGPQEVDIRYFYVIVGRTEESIPRLIAHVGYNLQESNQG